MTGWLFLAAAIVLEVGATLSLRMAATGKSTWYLAVGVGYVLSFTMLSQALVQGVPLGVAYGIWTAVGVAVLAILSRVLFREPLTLLMGVGVLLIAGGVLLIELGAAH